MLNIHDCDLQENWFNWQVHPKILKNNTFHISWTAWSSRSKSKIAYMIYIETLKTMSH